VSTETVYLRSPIWLQQMIVAGYGYMLRGRRFGGVHRKSLESLLRTQYFSSEAILELQQRGLTKVVEHAFAHVPHYRDLARKHQLKSSDITLMTLRELLPVLDKAQIRAEPERFISEAPAEKLLTINTSGTTGTPLEVACTRTALRQNYAFFSRFLEWHGVSYKSRSATFAGRPIVPQAQQKPPFWRVNPAFNNVQFSSYHLSPRNLEHYVRKLAEWAPEMIDSYPSSIGTIANYIIATGQEGRVRPRVIVTSSETLLDHQRAAIESAFACSVRDQYGSAEMVAFGAECEFGTTHIAPEYGVVEIVPHTGASISDGGRLVATGFINTAMPLLRYDTGDEAIPEATPCPCGRTFKSIRKILGRVDDVILTPEGTRIGRLDPIFKGSRGILECQIVQQQIDQVIIRAVLADGASPDVVTPVARQLERRLPPSMKICIECVPDLPRSRNGKLQAVLSMIR
jgi:phenylacetate-CoA ligase